MAPESLAVAETAFQHFAQGLQTGDWQPFLQGLTDDFRFYFPAGPFQGENVGKDRATAFFSQVSQIFPGGLTVEILQVTTGENTVVFEVRSHGTLQGHPYENQAAISLEVRGSQICGYREYLGVIYRFGEPT